MRGYGAFFTACFPMIRKKDEVALFIDVETNDPLFFKKIEKQPTKKDYSLSTFHICTFEVMVLFL